MSEGQGHADRELVYAGFWIRVWASIIDSVLILVVLFPLLSMIPGAAYSWAGSSSLVDAYGQVNYDAFALTLPGPLHVLLFWILPAVVVVVFWIARAATPGKMAIGARIVDARTGVAASSAQLIGRYFGYFVSTFPFCLGLLWVGMDARKQGWHDKLAGTVVVRDRDRALARARFITPSSRDGAGRTQSDGNP